MNEATRKAIKDIEASLPKSDGQDGRRALILRAIRSLGKNLSNALPKENRAALSSFLTGETKNPSSITPALCQEHLGIDPDEYQQADVSEWIKYVHDYAVLDPVQEVQMRIFLRRLDEATSDSVSVLWDVLKPNSRPGINAARSSIETAVLEAVYSSASGLNRIYNALNGVREGKRELDRRSQDLLIEIGFVLSLGLVLDSIKSDFKNDPVADGDKPKTGIVTATMAELWAALLDSAPPKFEKTGAQWRGAHAIGVLQAERGPGENDPELAIIQELVDRTGLPLVRIGDSIENLRETLHRTDRLIKRLPARELPPPSADRELDSELMASRDSESDKRAFYVLLTVKEANDARMQSALANVRKRFRTIRVFALPIKEVGNEDDEVDNEDEIEEIYAMSKLLNILNLDA